MWLKSKGNFEGGDGRTEKGETRSNDQAQPWEQEEIPECQHRPGSKVWDTLGPSEGNITTEEIEPWQLSHSESTEVGVR